MKGRSERAIFEERLDNFKNHRAMHTLVDLYWTRPGIEVHLVEVPPDPTDIELVVSKNQ